MKYLHPSELDRMGEKPPSPRAWPGHEATPSDLVFLSGLDWDRDLQGNRYAKKKIPKGDLYRSFVAAFLANETVGNIQLRLKESRFLWLIKTKSVDCIPLSLRQGWPESSLEYQVHVAANVDQIVARLIGTREVSPENKMVHRIFDSMVQRGLIERRAERQRVLHVFHLMRIKYQFPDSTVSVLNSQLAREAIRLLNEAERNRPDLYAKLVDSVQLGFWRQTNRSD